MSKISVIFSRSASYSITSNKYKIRFYSTIGTNSATATFRTAKEYNCTATTSSSTSAASTATTADKWQCTISTAAAAQHAQSTRERCDDDKTSGTDEVIDGQYSPHISTQILQK
jgi:hypothetical protein